MPSLSRFWGWAALALMLLPPAAEAQLAEAQPAAPDTTAVPLRLDALLGEVRAANPSLQAERLRAAALAERPAQVGALPDPVAGVVAQPFPVLTARGAQRSQWRLEQAVPFPGTRRLRREAAALGAEAAALEADALEADLVLDVKDAYYALYRAQAQAGLLEAFRIELRAFEDAATTRYEVGRGPQQAILKAQIERGRLALRLEALAAEAQSARARLARLTDQPADALAGRATLPGRALALAESGRLVEEALARRPEVEALEREAEQAERQIGLAKKAFWPDVTASATYFDIAETGVPPAATGRDALAVGLGVKVPLWRGRLRANLDEARLERERVERRREALRLRIRTQIADLQSRLARQQRQLLLLEETLLPQAETALEATLSAYGAGNTDFLDLLDAERTLLDLRLDRAETQARLLQTAAALERAAAADLFPGE